MKHKAYKANIIYTPTPAAFEVVPHGYVVVDDAGKVVTVSNALPTQWAHIEVEDLGDCILIPAMNDLHVHAPQFRNQGLAMDLELLPWLETYTFPEESKYANVAYARNVYSQFVRELWRHGTMRASVFATVHRDATIELARLFHKAGMGAMVGLVGMDRNCPEAVCNNAERMVNDTHALIDAVSDMPLVSAIATPRFVPSCSPTMMRAYGDLVAREGLPVQSHLSENHSEIAWVKELEPEASCYADAYRRYGLLGHTPTFMAHCCYSEGEEEQMLLDCGVTVVHCPTSNCNLGSGIAPVRRFLDCGIGVTLGSDISGGHHLSIFRVMQYALQMSKLHSTLAGGREAFLTLSEAFYMATKSGGSHFGRVGSFEPGYEFDALVIDDATLCDGVTPSYSLLERLERYVYLGDDRQLCRRYCSGALIPDPATRQ